MVDNIAAYTSKNPEELAQKVLQDFFTSSFVFPIDPFRLLSDYGVLYQFREFDRLEGLYLVPDDLDDIPLVGINVNRPITRQRFTAAHELCHHLKDRETQLCPMNPRDKNSIEKFADNFAAELLMPKSELIDYSRQFMDNNLVSLESALLIADYFGVSFEACVYRLAWTVKILDGDTNKKNLQYRIRDFKPDLRKQAIGLDHHNLQLYRHIVDNYHYSQQQSNFYWYKFKNDFIFNENRIEQLQIEEEEVAEIVTDLRLRKQDSIYCQSTHQPFIEVAGHSDMYDYISTTRDPITSFSLLKLSQLFYKYSPNPDAGGFFRTTNNYVANSKFETLDYSQIPGSIRDLNLPIQEALSEVNMSISEFIQKCALIHHRITVIHPFLDGNGRISRAFLNWMFFQKGLPPIYINHERKFDYFNALGTLDQTRSPISLCQILIEQLLVSQARLSGKRD